MAEHSVTAKVSGKNNEKKARRAAKLQQQGATDEVLKSTQLVILPEVQASAVPVAAGSSLSNADSKGDKKGRRAAKVQQKEAVSGGNINNTFEGPELDSKIIPAKEDQDFAKPSGEKKQLSKTERRAIQEAQRKAKQEKKSEGGSAEEKRSDGKADGKKNSDKSDRTQYPAADTASKTKSASLKSPKVSRSQFFSHLPAYRSSPPSKSHIHPAVRQVGLQFSKGVVCGSNARAVALLCALKKVIEDYATPDQKDLGRDLHNSLKHYMDFLNTCRPLSVSMESISKYLTPLVLNCRIAEESEAKAYLVEELDRFYKERIHSSDEVIARIAADKIVEDDVIVTYAHSSLVLKVLISAVKKHPRISVTVVDSRPKFEGREMLRKLVRACPGVSCCYMQINSVSYIMPRATKVLLGAHAVLANGYIMARTGTSQIALMAKAYNVPLLVCCETYKFSYKMQTDSFVVNELGDESQIVDINGHPGPLRELMDRPNLQLLNLCYDVTPPDYVTGLITETGVIPCTSAPVVIRVKQQYDLVNVRN